MEFLQLFKIAGVSFALLCTLFTFLTYVQVKKNKQPAVCRIFLSGRISFSLLGAGGLVYGLLFFLGTLLENDFLKYLAEPIIFCAFSIAFYIWYKVTRF